MDVLSPSHWILHATSLTDGDELLEGVGLFALGCALVYGFTLELLEVTIHLLKLPGLRDALCATARAHWRRLERCKAFGACAH